MTLPNRNILLFFVFQITVGAAQSLLKGSAQYIPYQGAQPTLIKGISQVLEIEKPAIRHVYLVDSNIIGLTVDSQYPERYTYLPYVRETKDSIVLQGEKVPKRMAEVTGTLPFVTPTKETNGVERFVYRDGKPLGWLIGKTYEYYWPVGALKGEPLNLTKIPLTANYELHAIKNGVSSGVRHPEQVYYKSKPHNTVRLDLGNYPAQRNEIYLKFSEPVEIGQKYSIKFNNGLAGLNAIYFSADDIALRTEALHVNLAGYHPDQASKTAYLSTWLGDGGSLDYAKHTTFQLIRADTKETVFERPIALKSTAEEELLHLNERYDPDNFSKTAVYHLDFSSFENSGEYQVYLPGVGVSFPFRIDQSVFEDAFKLQLKGYYHQRSGIAMQDPYTTYKRPRNHHPDDGHIIYSCDKEVFFDEDRYQQHHPTHVNPFYRIAQSINLKSENPKAFGGWMDATDYDRRYNHFIAVSNLLDVFEMNTGYFETLDLNIPESENNIPDIVDEALWGMRLFYDTQEEDGEIYYGVETLSHPSAGETSWNESLPMALVPGNPTIANLYAATATHMALVLSKYDTALSNKYLQSALKAVDWADKNASNPLYKKALQDLPPESWHQTNLSAYLYEATNDKKWEVRFLDNFERIKSDTSFTLSDENFKGMARYLLDRQEGHPNKSAQTSLRSMIIAEADKLLGMSSKMTYSEFEDFSRSPWLIEMDGSQILYTAYLLSENKKYLQTIVKAGDFGMGANPLNSSFTTGMGARFLYQWDEEAIITNENFATGIGVYGPIPFKLKDGLPDRSFFWNKPFVNYVNSIVHPPLQDWPVYETYFELFKYPAMNEFTVMENMADQAYRWGLLVAYFKN